MPANLTPEYFAAERRYREARAPKEKLDALQEMLRVIPKHKGTDHMRADLKKKVSQLKKDAQKKSVRAVHSLYVKPEGIGQLFLLGPPNAGKSSLLDALTNARPAVADYPFTTTMYQPGMVRYVDVWIQLVDMPPISSAGTMPWIPSVARYGDGAFLVVSLASDDVLSEIEEVQSFLATGKVELAQRHEPGGMFDNGIAALKTTMVATHCRAPDAHDRLEMVRELTGDGYDIVQVDLKEDPESVEALRTVAYRMLGKLRVYTKHPGKPPDLDEPFVVRQGTTLQELAGKIHKDIKERLNYARIWSQDRRKFDGQRVARSYVLQEGDVVEIHL